MLWMRGVPLHQGSLSDLWLRDLLELDLVLARARMIHDDMPEHWWEIPALAEADEIPDALPELLTAVHVVAAHRRSASPISFDEVLATGVTADEVEVGLVPAATPERLPRGFRPSAAEGVDLPIEGMDLHREVHLRSVQAMGLLGLRWADLWDLPLSVWLAVSATVDAQQERR